MKMLMCALALSLLLWSCQGERDLRAPALKRAQAFIKQGSADKAYSTLDSALMVNPQMDSVYYLHSDLALIRDPGTIEVRAIEINNRADGWAKIKAGEYDLNELGLHFSSSADLMRPALLAMRPKVAAILAARKKAEREQVAAVAISEKRKAQNEEEDNYEKRGKIEKGLRESFLDSGMDVEVKVSGKRRSRVTLEYALMGAVLAHQMNKEGNINTLLNLGFKEVVLTDGYDYRTVWTRKH